MKFGVRQICDVVFKAKADMKIGKSTFKAGQPVLYIDTATTSSLEGASTTVYAQGGKGNPRLIAWDGEKTLTFTVEDALLSPIGFAILSGAGLFKADNSTTKVHVHKTAAATIGTSFKIDLKDSLGTGEYIDDKAPIFVALTENDGSVTGDMIKVQEVGSTATSLTVSADTDSDGNRTVLGKIGNTVFVDFYVAKSGANVDEMQIDSSLFGGNFYVEASTLFRRQADGKDLPAEITFPNVKIQSNFTFNMSSTGDPSTFSFTMDALPGYTLFDRTKKVMCVMQVIDDTVSNSANLASVMEHGVLSVPETQNDSATSNSGDTTNG